MTTIEYVFVFYFILFGAAELITNLFHLSKKTNKERSESAKKQHQEIPSDLSEKHYLIKAVIMFAFGIVFFAAGIYMIFYNEFVSILFYGTMIPFSLYSLIQAFIYRKCWRVWSAMIVYNLPLIIFLFLR
jgi:hypothetical protein